MMLAVVMAILLLFKIFSYKSWERYYYTSSVSNPEAFPIHLFGIAFIMENGEYSGDFYNDLDIINSFNSDWGRGTSYEAYNPQFLPKSLFVEYMDFRTQKYYIDTIILPKEKMYQSFEIAKKQNKLSDLAYGRRKMGLSFHVGIANDGNILIWLLGDDYQLELYRKKIHPKPFTGNVVSKKEPEPVGANKSQINYFADVPDSLKRKIMELKVDNVEYKDSVPVYFDQLRP